MNYLKLYFDIMALQYSLTQRYWEGMIKGMEKVNRDYTNEANR